MKKAHSGQEPPGNELPPVPDHTTGWIRPHGSTNVPPGGGANYIVAVSITTQDEMNEDVRDR